jgi:hypothetical protein
VSDVRVTIASAMLFPFVCQRDAFSIGELMLIRCNAESWRFIS